MGLDDRDYMRRRTESPGWDSDSLADKLPWRRVLRWMATAALGLLLLTIVLPAAWSWWITPTRDRPLELNTAPEAALRRLPRMNPKLLHAIIEARPYKSVDDLIRAYGVGPKTLEALRPYVYVRSNAPPAGSLADRP